MPIWLRHLRRLCAVDVHCMGAPRPGAFAYRPDPRLGSATRRCPPCPRTLVMNALTATVDHSHTWYTALAEHLARYSTTSACFDRIRLEPLRPWKQGNSAAATRYRHGSRQTAVLAASAVIAVGSAMRNDMLRVYPSLDRTWCTSSRNRIDTETW